MGAEEETERISDRAHESRADGGTVEAARDGQEKPATLKKQEEQHAELRKQGMTPSSMDLPPVDFLLDEGGELVAKIADAVIPTGVRPEDTAAIQGPGGQRRQAAPQLNAEQPATSASGGGVETSQSRASSEIEERAPGVKTRDGSIKMEPLVVTGNYRGEDIRRVIEPTVIEDTKGKTLKDIARDHLGSEPPPSEEEIQKHVREIARINNIKNPDKPLDGTPVTLPGHDKYGGMVTQDAEGNKRTVYLNGDMVFQNKDGTGLTHKPTADGSGYSEHHWGPRPEDNYELRKTADGRYEVADAGKDNFKPPESADDARVERAKLRDLADARITDPKERARFEADMVKFDARAKELQEQYEKQGKSPEEAAREAQKEMAKTYREISRLLEAPDNPNLPMIKDRDRVMLAEQVMHQAADPKDVSQGEYNTCNVTTIESRTYTRSPSEAARLVADVATKGEYTSNGKPPVTVKVPDDINPGSLEKHGQSKDAHTPGTNHRSFAGQVFEVAAVNIHYKKANEQAASDHKAANEAAKGKPPDEVKKIDDEYFKKYSRHINEPPPQIKYEQQKPGPDQGPNSDNGERLVDYSRNGPNGRPPAEVLESDNKTPKRAPGISPLDIAGVAKEICSDLPDGKDPGPVRLDYMKEDQQSKELTQKINETTASMLKAYGIGEGKPFDLNDREAFKKAREAIDSKEGLSLQERHMLRKAVDDLERRGSYYNLDGIAYIDNEQQMNTALARLKAEGRLPIIVGVHTGQEPFATDVGEAGARGGAHVVTITDYNPGPPPVVSVDNQWHAGADHANLPVSDLYKAMRHRDSDNRIADLEAQAASNRAANRVDYAVETELLFQKRAAGKLKDDELIDGVAKSFGEFLKARREGKITDEQKDLVIAKLKELKGQLPPDKQKQLDERLIPIRQEHDRLAKAQGR